jgi:transposase-like protein
MIENMVCTECHKEAMHKAGFVMSGRKRIQRYVCNSCYRTTTKVNIKEEAEVTTVQVITSADEEKLNALQ